MEEWENEMISFVKMTKLRTDWRLKLTTVEDPVHSVLEERRHTVHRSDLSTSLDRGESEEEGSSRDR